MHLRLDAIDRRLLDLLSQHGRMTNRNLAERLDLSESACSARLRKLEQDGVGYTAIISPQFTGHAVRALVEMKLSRSGSSAREAFEALLRGANSVMAAYQTVQADDYIVKLGAPDVLGIQAFLDQVSRDGIVCEPQQRWLIAKRVKALAPTAPAPKA